MSLSILLRSKSSVLGTAICLLFLGAALFAPLLAPRNPYTQDLGSSLRPPGHRGYLLGADQLGRDVLSRILHGARVSLCIGCLALMFGAFLGIPMGLVSGYYGGWLDSVMMRMVDVLLSIPRILLAIVIVATYGVGFWTLVLAVGLPDIAIFARLARSLSLKLVQLDYVAAAKAMGGRDARIMFRHVLPGLVGPIAVQLTFSMAAAILIAGSLSYLGLGIRPPTPEWGSMMAQGRLHMRSAPHLVTYPGLALGMSVLGINLLGDGLRQAIDPRFVRRN
ncbi:MAG: ABC transporter permease [bacterium]|nr:ABC transporter permease [bacterium]